MTMREENLSNLPFPPERLCLDWEALASLTLHRGIGAQSSVPGYTAGTSPLEDPHKCCLVHLLIHSFLSPTFIKHPREKVSAPGAGCIIRFKLRSYSQEADSLLRKKDP